MPIHCEWLTNKDGTVIGHAQVADKVYRRFLGDCENCDRRRRMVRRFDGIYYGYTERCLACGTCSMDGYVIGTPDRDTSRRWWNEAIPAREFDRRVRQILRSFYAEADEE